MDIVTSFSASAVPRDQLSAILSDQLAFENAQVFRRLLVVRCGGLAAAAGLAGALLHEMSWAARILPTVLFLAPPVWAWVVERRLGSRVSERLARIERCGGLRKS